MDALETRYRNGRRYILWLCAAILCMAGMTIPAKAVNCVIDLSDKVVQTDATDNSATISWPLQTEASGYYIFRGGSSVIEATLPGGAASYTVSDMSENQITKIVVQPYIVDGATGQIATGIEGMVQVKTLSKVTGVCYGEGGFASNGKSLSIGWETASASDGYEAVLYSKKGKKLQTVNTVGGSSNSAIFTKANRSNVYYVKVRCYVSLMGDYKAYGESSDKFYALPQPKLISNENDVKINSIRLRWQKVKGADSYTIYASNNIHSKQVKIATVKKTSYTMKKIKKKPVNTLKKPYYVSIVTNSNAGGKLRKAENQYCINPLGIS